MAFRYYNDGEYEWGKYRKRFVRTGEFRAPKKGERYISGAIPHAYLAPNDFETKFWIAREATREETHCSLCQQLLPVE